MQNNRYYDINFDNQFTKKHYEKGKRTQIEI